MIIATYIVIGVILGLGWEVYTRAYWGDSDLKGFGMVIGAAWPIAVVVGTVVGSMFLLNKLVDRWVTNIKHVEKAQEYKQYNR
jgi:hypothetical protein